METNNNLAKRYRRLYKAFCEFLESDGRYVICGYGQKLQDNHLLQKTGPTTYQFFKTRMDKYLKTNPKTSRQKLVDKYNSFIANKNLENLSDYEKGYYDCLKQLMVAFKLMASHVAYPSKEEEGN
jgi:hypothetical protein